MARIAGIDLPRQKHAHIADPHLWFGVSRARRILEAAGVEGSKKIQDLNEEEVNHIRQS